MECSECKDWLLKFIDRGGGYRDDVGEVMYIFGLSPGSSMSAGNGGTVDREFRIPRRVGNVKYETRLTAVLEASSNDIP